MSRSLLLPPLLDAIAEAREEENQDVPWDLDSVTSFTPEDYAVPRGLASRPSPSSSSSWTRLLTESESSPRRNVSSASSGSLDRDEGSVFRECEARNHSGNEDESFGQPERGCRGRVGVAVLAACESKKVYELGLIPHFRYLSPLIPPLHPLAAFNHRPLSQSPLLLELLQFGRPTGNRALHSRFFPFSIASAEVSEPLNLPVVKLTNIPFSVSREQVVLFLGCHHRAPDSFEPIHIIMCRNTGKTMEVFIELLSDSDVVALCMRYEEGKRTNQPIKMGDRAVTVSPSSQEELMHRIFPTASGIAWKGQRPALKRTRGLMGLPGHKFRGFISEEEMTMVVRHVEYPLKSPFSRNCPERAFEYLISTLHKYPWRYTRLITIGERFKLFRLTFQLLDTLEDRIQTHSYPGRLTPRLLQRVVDAALRCPGFTPFMKTNMAQIVALDASQLREYNLPPNASEWRHQYGLVVKPRMPDDLIEWYIQVIRRHTRSSAGIASKQPSVTDAGVDTRCCAEHGTDSCYYWGHFWSYFPDRLGDAGFEERNLQSVMQEELDIVKKILIDALG
ncbi:uncharacterized protein BROUX77_006158 [Berkeleyomyces rouxiae]|uniref:uncharacterized protein n=1 Tax=Berkeleyomyces rouxiae TaxID=2035830 RepID=UPI003B7BFA74